MTKEQLTSKDFPIYFHDTSNNKGVRFATKYSPGFRHVKGKRESNCPSTLGLDFWLDPATPRVTFQEFRKIG